MLIGDTYYYHMRANGIITRDAGFDRDTPDHTSDGLCKPTEIHVWCCRNGDGRVAIAAGDKVRARYHSDEAIAAALPK